MPSIAVLGGLLTDYIIPLPRLPKLGESLDAAPGQAVLEVPGGKGGNVCVAAVRVSRVRPDRRRDEMKGRGGGGGEEEEEEEEEEVRVYMNGAVGDDEAGKRLKSGLQAEGVHVDGVQELAGAKSGVCVVLVEEGSSGESGNVGVPGANARYRLPGKEEGVRGLVGGAAETPPDLLVMNLAQISRDEVVLPVLGMARRAGVDVFLNASPAEHLVGIPAWWRGVKSLVVNEHEAVVLCGVAEVRSVAGRRAVWEAFLGDDDDGAESVVLTLGKEGAYFAEKGGGGREGFVAGVKAERVVDTTGAGDCFLGAYAVEYVRQKQAGGWDIAAAVRFACKAAAKSVERMGCQAGLPYADEIV
ncbi:hypothetical protein OIDMADRAFT_110789 [Lecanosticta acicola]|uniref:Ribokinase n=1 Tax=Lecanosticta acicola TaxID=111012 RepID=A0AAI8Z2W1_9PEZI|nr:hypothetical protein OIDMADRAFT_110789 [Lecanosticta acicola]